MIVTALVGFQQAPVALPGASRPGARHGGAARPGRGAGAHGALGSGAAPDRAGALAADAGAARAAARSPARRDDRAADRGPAADAYFARLMRRVETAPVDASFAVTAAGGVRVVPSRPGTTLDVPASAKALLAPRSRPCIAWRSSRWSRSMRNGRPPTRRRWGSPAPSRATRPSSAAMPNRIHNVQRRGAPRRRAADRRRGELVSFNDATGERTAAKGFLEAPVIINGELADRARRRRLPGLDDRLQRRLRGRAPDHCAHEPRALHQPLPARAGTRPSTTRTSTCASSTTRATGSPARRS